MSDEKQETKDDILAELRRQSNEEHALATKLRSGDCDDVDYACASCYDEDAKYLSQIANRLEAAAKREKEQPGDAAAMRDALEAVVAVGYPHNFQREAPHIREYCYDITEAIKKCFAALSAPAPTTEKSSVVGN